MIKKLLILLIVPFATLSAQQVNNVKLTVEGDKIVVTYDIDDYSTRYLYDISITFQSTTKITPFALSGDVGKDLTGGKNKKIVWDIYQDIDGLSGNLRADITVKEGTKLKHMGGPANAIKSLILPGLGDYWVYKNKWHPILMHAAAIGCISGFFISDADSKDNYSLYLKSQSQGEMDKYYSDYKGNIQARNFFLVMAGAIYVYDISFVIVNGVLNKRNHPYFDNKQKKTLSSLYLKPSPYSIDGFQLSYVLNF